MSSLSLPVKRCATAASALPAHSVKDGFTSGDGDIYGRSPQQEAERALRPEFGWHHEAMRSRPNHGTGAFFLPLPPVRHIFQKFPHFSTKKEHDYGKDHPRTLSGFMELLPAPQQQMERMMEILRKTYSLYGFTPLDTPSSRPARCCWPRAAARRRSRSTASRRATPIWPCGLT